MTEAAGEVRVCEYRRCGAPLPPAVGRGSRARFCQDGKTWGRRNLSCRDAEAVLSDAESLREADTQLDDTAVTALAGQIDRVLEPAAGLVDVLTTLRQQLDATTAAALAERDAARAEAEEDRRRRGIAEAEAAQARGTAKEATERAAAAEKVRAAAVKERDHELAVRMAATEELQRAEGKLAAVREELQRLIDREQATAALAAERAETVAALTAELGAATTALAEERARAEAAVAAERDRTEEARRHAETALAEERERTRDARQRAEAAIAEERERTKAAEARAAALAERLDAELERHRATREDIEKARAAFDRRLAELQATHEQTVRSMHETIAKKLK